MTFVRVACIAMLVLQGGAQIARAQETAATPAQSPGAPAAEEKQRSEEETRKQLEQLACGPPHVHLLHHTEKEPQALREPAPEEALIYVIRTKQIVGSALGIRVAMDGKWVGINRIGEYFYLEIGPGPHNFCSSVGSSRGLLSLMIEKGKSYYLHQVVTLEGLDLDLLDEKQGKEYVTRYHRSFFEEKQKK